MTDSLGTVMPSCAALALAAASPRARRFAPFQAWIPGLRAFPLVMFANGPWRIVQGFDLH